MQRSNPLLLLISPVLLIVAWHAAVVGFQIPNYFIPTPLAVANALKVGYIDGQFWPHLAYTLQAMLAGYAAGCGLALVLGAVLAESPTAERLLMPYIVALQSMPKVALAPLIIVWFGFGLASKIVMVALVCFFPMFVNTVTGLRQADPALIEMMRAYSGSRWQMFWRVRVPAAAGPIFAGLQIAIVLSLIGAVVAEFISSTQGLGYLINAAAVGLETNVMFAALISLAGLGIAGSSVVRLLHRRLVFWDKSAAVTVAEG
jgi:NitT/TauT family transport system permease protein